MKGVLLENLRPANISPTFRDLDGGCRRRLSPPRTRRRTFNHPEPRRTDHPFFAQAKNHPEVIAQGGGGRERPCKTIYAYKRAAAIGADVLEMGVYLTKDDGPVLMHDADLSRATQGKGHVNDLTLEELRSLNADFNRRGDGGTSFPFRGQDLQAEVLRELRVRSR